ncbi:MAG: hypothetical protein P8N02_09555 [Actinomycetota bacterium]|nr:hypothetical protein [Actinomycetota bacterium]
MGDPGNLEPDDIRIEAVIVAVTDQVPRVLTVGSEPPSLPSVDLRPDDRTLELALRRGIEEQTGLEVGYVEQLYTFGDLGRVPGVDSRQVSIAYLALMREQRPSANAHWTGWHRLFPWEDRRDGVPAAITEVIAPRLAQWVDAADNPATAHERRLRCETAFGLGEAAWDGVRALERYELLWELGLLDESATPDGAIPSTTMALDHRRIVASAVGRLRGKLTYRPTVFELLPERFTLLQLQLVVEALAGVALHKQNFRRLVDQGGLVEGTGETMATGGRPAELFTFRRAVVAERPRPGLGSPWA